MNKFIPNYIDLIRKKNSCWGWINKDQNINKGD